MTVETFNLYLKLLKEFPRPHQCRCQNCGSKFITKLRIDHPPGISQIQFHRPRFCKCKPENNQRLVIAKTGAEQMPILSRELKNP